MMNNKEYDEMIALKKIKQGTSTAEDAGFEEPDFEVEQSGGDKVKNFWYHHKWKVFAAIGVLFVLSVMIWQFTEREHFDTEVFIAATTLEDGNEAYYKAELADLDENGIGLWFATIKTDGSNDQFTATNKQKFIISLQTKRTEYYVLDDDVYAFYEEQLKDSFVKVRVLSNEFTLYKVNY